MMLATRKRSRLNRKACLPVVEQLEDRCVFNVAWHAQLPVEPVVQTEVLVVVTLKQPPVNSEVVVVEGLGSSVSSAAHEGIHGLDLAVFIHLLQGQGSPVSGDGGSGGTGGPVSGGGSSSGGTGNSGGPVGDGGSSTGSSQGNGSSMGDSNPGTGTTPTPAPAPGDGSQAVAATPAAPAEHGDGSKAHAVSSTGTAAPAASPQATAISAAALAVASVPANGETAVGRPVVVPHEAVVRTDLHADAVAAVVNAASTNNTVRIDALPGGTEQLAFVPRPQDSGNPVESPLAPRQTPAAPAAAAPAAAKNAPAATGAQDKADDTGAEPQEAGVLTKVPVSAVPPLGLEKALRRLKDLLADLTTSRALLHVLPVTGALAVMGGAAFGLVRWRRKKRLAKKDVPDEGTDDEEKDTWLPGSGSLPPVDPA